MQSITSKPIYNRKIIFNGLFTNKFQLLQPRITINRFLCSKPDNSKIRTNVFLDHQSTTQFVESLSETEKRYLLDELHADSVRKEPVQDRLLFENIHAAFSMIDTDKSGSISRSEWISFVLKHKPAFIDMIAHPASPPTRKDLSLLALNQAIPFIGFGFIDNALMIMFGEVIDIKLGVAFGISTMAAAGLGNLMSDVVGLGFSGAIESFCEKLGIPTPSLSREQLSMRKTRMVSTLGSMFGVTIGCLLGLLPLLFFEDHHPHKREKENKENKEKSQN